MMQGKEEAGKKRHKKGFSKDGSTKQAHKQLDKGMSSKRKKFSSKDSHTKPSPKRAKLHTSSPLDNKTHKTAALNTDDGTMSRHRLKKKLTEARKKHANPHFEVGKEVKELWESLRKRNLGGAERSRITSLILEKMKGKAPEMVTSHVMSRVLQTCLKYCTPDQRASIHDELRPHFLQLVQNTYSHHLVAKMLDQAATNKDQLHKMISSLHGHVVPFLRHPVASAVVEHTYKLASNVQKQELLAEFFSPEYRLFKGIISKGSGRLVDLLGQEPPSKRRSVLEHMTGCLQPILEKGIVDHSIIHRALVEYLSIASKALAVDVLQQLSGPLLIRMIHTKDGAKIGVTCVATGTRKERKKIIKGMKGNAAKVACDSYGCWVLMEILDVIDDTEMLNKFIVNELAKNVEQIALDRHGRRVILHLLSPQKSQYILADALTPIPIGSGIVDEEKAKEEEELPTVPSGGSSKKDPFLRRMEILKSSSLAERLVDTCVLRAGELLRSPLGKDLIFEVAKGAHDGILLHVTPHGVARLHQAIADLGAQDRAVGASNGDNEEHVFEQYHASRTIRRLMLEARAPSDAVMASSFVSVLWKTALKGKCRQWAEGHSQKIVSALELCDDAEVKKDAMRELQPLFDSAMLRRRADDHYPPTEAVQGAKQKRPKKGK